MHLFELHELIENGENSSVEFKRRFSSAEKIAKEMIAFANTKGGMLLFGVDDNKTVVGVESEKGELELIDTVAKFYCEPEVKYEYEILHIYKKDVIVVSIPESTNKPHTLIENNSMIKSTQNETNGEPTNGSGLPRVYIRIKDKSVLASRETIRILKRSNPNSPPMILTLGDKEKFLLDYLAKHERITLKELRKHLNISERRASRILVNLVRAELIRLNPGFSGEKEDFYTLS